MYITFLIKKKYFFTLSKFLNDQFSSLKEIYIYSEVAIILLILLQQYESIWSR
jgi:hypothetical protein